MRRLGRKGKRIVKDWEGKEEIRGGRERRRGEETEKGRGKNRRGKRRV